MQSVSQPVSRWSVNANTSEHITKQNNTTEIWSTSEVDSEAQQQQKLYMQKIEVFSKQQKTLDVGGSGCKQ